MAVLSSFLVFTFGMGSNSMRAGANTGSMKHSQLKNKGNQQSAVKNSNSKKVNVEFIVSKSTVKKSPISTLAHASPVKKSFEQKINEKSAAAEKSITNDIFDFEKEAHFEVKQSLDNLADSMKGQ